MPTKSSLTSTEILRAEQRKSERDGQAKNIRKGDIVLWHGLRMEITSARSSRAYPGYRAVQMRTPDGEIIAHDIYWSDKITFVVENKS